MKLKILKKSFAAMLTVLIICCFIPIKTAAASFKLNYSKISLVKGYSCTLKVSGSSKKVKWSTSNKKIAAVSSSGKVIAKSAGSCYVTAKIGKESVRCKVTVVNGKLTLSKSTLDIKKGDSAVITVTAKGSHLLKCKVSEKNIASASWAKTFKGNKIGLKITGKSEGTTTFKIYMSKYTSVYKTLTVNVFSSDETDMAVSESSKYSPLEPLSQEAEIKLKEDFYKYKLNDWYNPKIEDMYIQYYYGTYNGCEAVVMYSHDMTFTDDLKSVSVGGYKFILPSGSFEILLHKDSSFVDINTAYEYGYLTDEDLAAIYYYANEQYIQSENIEIEEEIIEEG